MKILYLQDHAGIGGAQLSLLDLIDGLRAGTANVEPHVVIGGEGFLAGQLAVRRISTEVVRFLEYRKAKDFFRRPEFVRRLVQLCRQWHIDLVHANTYQMAPWSAVLARKLPTASCVTVREIIDSRRIRKYRVLDNDAVIAISRAVQEKFPASAKVRQIYNGIACPKFLPANAEVLARLKIPAQTGHRVGFLGTLSERKGPQVLLEAVPVVLQKAPDTVFVFIGDGEEEFKGRLQAQAAKLGIGQSVIFAGSIENGARYLRAFDLFVMPSFTEGIGRAAVEAMYAGLPVVASRVGGLVEVVENGQTGRLVAPDDVPKLAQAILFYLESEPQRRAHGEHGRRRAQQLFDLKQYAGHMADLYSHVLKVRAS